MTQQIYVLDGQEPVPADAKTWGDWMEHADRRLDHTEFHTPDRMTLVRTDFIGVGMIVEGSGPFFFCTVVTSATDLVPHYAVTWAEALVTHASVVAAMKARYRGAA